MHQFAKTVAATTTRGSAIRPVPEGAVFVSITRFEDDDDRNHQTFTVLMPKEQALAFAQSVQQAAERLPLVNEEA